MGRRVYNNTVDFYNKSTEKLSWMKLASKILGELPQDYIKVVPYQIKKIAVRDANIAFVSNCKKTKKLGTPFELHFKSKRNPVQSCYITKSAVKEQGIYYTIAGKLKSAERLAFEDIKDCRLVLENNRWFLTIPVEATKQIVDNQNNIVSIDPGVRAFCTFFSTDGYFGHLGFHDFTRIYRLVYAIDKLISKRDLAKDKQKKLSFNRAIKNIRFKISNLVSELHNKVALFLVKNFDIIIYPKFRTQQMSLRSKRKLNKKSTRAMLSWSFYKFELKLINKCKEYGKQLVRCSEAYTSKTNSFTGELMNIGSKEYFKHDNIKINRDVNGARGIMLRVLRDTSACANESFTGCLVAC